MDILKDLWSGQLSPADRPNPRTEVYITNHRKMDKYEALVQAKLDEEGKAAFMKYMDAETLCDCERLYAAFADGFRLGAQLALAAVQDA